MEKSLLVIVRHKPGRTRLLMRALKSINDQTFKKINIVIFCMGEELKRHHVDDFYLKELSSIYTIIYDENRIFDTIKMSKSNYLCFIDDDDSWAPEYVSRLLSLLANIQSTYSSVNAISCHTNKVTEVAENNRIIINTTQPWNHYLNAGPVSFDVIYYRNSIPLSSCLFDKNSVMDVIENHKLSSPAFFWPFFIHYLAKNDVWILPEALAFYHFRENDDFEFGNYTVINNESFDIECKIAENKMMRSTDDSSLLNVL
ncbi:glycosyltransferase family 2 protein, partial [Salmonella enterica subsp. houtenae]|nr:glycosyltransferase family 2 protein [Salmonella enterica]EDW1520503.1 glycosyltransferase family 2 protein [Salmonella enterica subsp. houtenae]EDX2471388.1 glycosyltransferase family 2 protein [Salmonella enterica]EDY0043302.1 glycosyltransferase family 2 protein [Salmonella enterica]EEG3680730.1 glycosyltransferase family 2 protein [Salmonella enterica]